MREKGSKVKSARDFQQKSLCAFGLLMILMGKRRLAMTLIKHSVVNQPIHQIFANTLKLAILTGDINKVNQLLEDEALSLHCQKNYRLILYWSAQSPNAECLKRFLNIPKIEAHIDTLSNWCFQEAVRVGNFDVVRVLLGYDAIKRQAGVNQNFALKQAIGCGYPDLTYLLLTIDNVRANIHHQGNDYFKLACLSNSTETLNILLNDQSIFKTIKQSFQVSVNLVIEQDFNQVLQRLLEVDGIGEQVQTNEFLLQAVNHQSLGCLKVLLSLPGMASKITHEHFNTNNLEIIELMYEYAMGAGVSLKGLHPQSVAAQHIEELAFTTYTCLKLRALNLTKTLEDNEGKALNLKKLNKDYPKSEEEQLSYGLQILMNLPKDVALKTLSYLPLMQTKTAKSDDERLNPKLLALDAKARKFAT